MISKKFIFSLGCVIFLLLTIGAVSASTVDMAGVKFNIPEGYDEFEDVWTGYDVEQDKIDIICAIHKLNPEQQLFRNLESKIGVNIAREYGTQFVEKFCNIKIINYL